MKVNPRIVVASVLGILLVGGSYLLSIVTQEETSSAMVVKPVAEMRQFINVRDADGDGLPDWQNTLDVSTIDLDAEYTPDSTPTGLLTSSLINLAETGNGSIEGLMLELGPRLKEELTVQRYTESDIKTGMDNSPAALRTYGNLVAAIALEHAPPAGTEDEITILNRALVRNDSSVLLALDPTITSYDRMMAAMLEATVPSSLAKEHLQIINAYQEILFDIRAFKNAFEDPLTSTLRTQRYPGDVGFLYLSINSLYVKLKNNGIVWSEGDTAAKLIKIDQ